VQKGLLRPGPASLVLATLLSTLSCRNSFGKAEPVTIGQLAAMLKGTDPPRLYDTNGDQTRREYGVIPGATLLPSSREYSIELLPPSKEAHLVFYCASTWCGAAEKAAERALGQGYKSVSVLPDGIKGWTEAGLPTTPSN
jgi:rhodanese-related sulfurtransferase